ncbi:MAG: thioredoxin protein [Bacteroidetes bacterium]|nr:thioredoxin protein [Bacteroidota bacterium]
MSGKKHTNSLIDETSPYLLQHAHNPVNWYAWNEKTLEKAKAENKLILVSVGYSACHWCHVMEHESFEDETVAQIMNDHFICIKVDREERPDIDQVYMMAVQLMTGHGGWPLNCFALPDGRPIYGGTYFPKEQWINILLNLTDLYQHDQQKALDYATQLTEGVRLAELVKINEASPAFTMELLHTCYENWQTRFDNTDGGPNKAPKFPLPNNYQFLLHYAKTSNNEKALEHVNITLQKMGYGGIYDQIGGGFSRYSVDHYWKVPHFEKMLYDNAQLVTLYSEAFRATGNLLYKQIVFETLAFVERELTSPENGFYSALDADSEGVEGKYYVWTKEELQALLKNDFEVFADYFNVNERGLWEHGTYILLRNDDDETIAKRHSISAEALLQLMEKCKKQLLALREKRIHPGLDNKILTSWNALMLKGYVDAYNAFGEERFLKTAVKNADFLLKYALSEGNELSHLAVVKPRIGQKNGFLEDYSFMMEALIALYQATFNESYLLKAEELMHYCEEHFLDSKSGMFFFTSDLDHALITRKMELSDNVIPASNSSMAKCLFLLGHYLENESYVEQSKQMLNNVLPEIEHYGAGYSNWATLLLYFSAPFYEVAIVGKTVDEKYRSFQKHYLPNVIFAGSATQSTLPLLMNRFTEDQTFIYVCENKTCLQPVKEVAEALKLIR